MSSATATLEQIATACGDTLPLPPRGEEQVFAAPWQAQVFAMTVVLHERGIASAEDVERTTQAWHDAAARTPHGRPIAL